MRLPVTRYGLPQVVIYPLLVLVFIVLLLVFIKPLKILIPLELILAVIFIWMLSFFRDPVRNIIMDESILYCPADGTITDISEVEGIAIGKDGVPVKAIRIGMFLSIYNVHVNRFPCSVMVENLSYKKGQFKNAGSSDAGRVNESNDIYMTRLAEPLDRLLVRQISGAVARHIVCEAIVGSKYSQGEKFGMIKFGSRTEIYVPLGANFEVAVKTGDKVKAGLTPLLRYLP
ncbi:MAG: phosphatidylserine decarboxylase [Treponema sp.]|nr:phosphatidylserine decarboxylase [Treponema sp.]